MEREQERHRIRITLLLVGMAVLTAGTAWADTGPEDLQTAQSGNPADGRKSGGNCDPTCLCAGLDCPPSLGDCSGCTGDDGPSLGDDEDDCELGEICTGGGDPPGGGNPPLGSCYGTTVQLECMDDPEDPHNDGCVCGQSATPIQEAHYFACYEGLHAIPLPPNGSCEIICGPSFIPDELQGACMELCAELCEDNPGCIDLSDLLIEWICCDLATGTSVPWADCSNTNLHPFPTNPSSQCCIQNNENSWYSGCEACCAVHADYGSTNYSRCIQKCDIAHLMECELQ